MERAPGPPGPSLSWRARGCLGPGIILENQGNAAAGGVRTLRFAPSPEPLRSGPEPTLAAARNFFPSLWPRGLARSEVSGPPGTQTRAAF